MLIANIDKYFVFSKDLSQVIFIRADVAESKSPRYMSSGKLNGVPLNWDTGAFSTITLSIGHEEGVAAPKCGAGSIITIPDWISYEYVTLVTGTAIDDNDPTHGLVVLI